MHIAVVMGTMLLGSWVLNTPDAEEEAGIPEEVQQVMPSSPTSPTSPYNVTTPRPSPMGQGGYDRGQPGGSHQHSAPAGGQSIRSVMPTYIPTPPTDTSTDVFGQPAAPTSNSARARGRSVPMAPTESSSLGSRAGFDTKLSSPLTQNRGPASHGNVASAPSPAAEKAFAGYQPSSGVSPYMNLFRIGGETIDNYTSLVRPQIEQRFLNQQFNRDIRGLDNTSRMQRVDMQQLYRANQTLQGVATPQFYMNYGSYYQGGGQ